MAFLNVKLSGFDELRGRLTKAVEKVPREVDAELALAADLMRGRAIDAAPADQGTLRAEIQSQQSSFLHWGVFSNSIYSGYQEFGTKSKVSVPPGLQEVAAQLKGSAESSLNAKEAIYAWCKRHGIDKEFWWPIFVRIMVSGVKPHPYFFKQLEAVRPELLRNIENILARV
jgi:HK97 gp10 family phage protein